MYELSNLNGYTDAVLLNNPIAVQENLMQLGILQDGSTGPEHLKQVLAMVDISLLPQALDVPVNPGGAYADQLIECQFAHGNRAMLESLLLNHATIPPAATNADWSELLQLKMNWRSAFAVIGLLIGLLLIIFLIRKI